MNRAIVDRDSWPSETSDSNVLCMHICKHSYKGNKGRPTLGDLQDVLKFMLEYISRRTTTDS